MAGVAHHFELDTAHAEAGLRALSGWQIAELAYNVGALLESSTRERIATEKTSPEGAPWAPWSEHYAATRHGGQSLLMGGGGLLDSIANVSRGSEAIVGSNLVYAAVHQSGAGKGAFGTTSRGTPIPWGDIPARPYLGISGDDRRAIDELVEGELRELVQ